MKTGKKISSLRGPKNSSYTQKPTPWRNKNDVERSLHSCGDAAVRIENTTTSVRCAPRLIRAEPSALLLYKNRSYGMGRRWVGAARRGVEDVEARMRRRRRRRRRRVSVGEMRRGGGGGFRRFRGQREKKFTAAGNSNAESRRVRNRCPVSTAVQNSRSRAVMNLATSACATTDVVATAGAVAWAAAAARRPGSVVEQPSDQRYDECSDERPSFGRRRHLASTHAHADRCVTSIIFIFILTCTRTFPRTFKISFRFCLNFFEL